jgi:hypothetical protein
MFVTREPCIAAGISSQYAFGKSDHLHMLSFRASIGKCIAALRKLGLDEPCCPAAETLGSLWWRVYTFGRSSLFREMLAIGEKIMRRIKPAGIDRPPARRLSRASRDFQSPGGNFTKGLDKCSDTVLIDSTVCCGDVIMSGLNIWLCLLFCQPMASRFPHAMHVASLCPCHHEDTALVLRPPIICVFNHPVGQRACCEVAAEVPLEYWVVNTPKRTNLKSPWYWRQQYQTPAIAQRTNKSCASYAIKATTRTAQGFYQQRAFRKPVGRLPACGCPVPIDGAIQLYEQNYWPGHVGYSLPHNPNDRFVIVQFY